MNHFNILFNLSEQNNYFIVKEPNTNRKFKIFLLNKFEKLIMSYSINICWFIKFTY
jgi:hypothetical protein